MDFRYERRTAKPFGYNDISGVNFFAEKTYCKP